MKIMAITGHRPESLTETPERVRERLREAFKDTGTTQIYQGMAAGVDLWSAGVAWQEEIPYIAVMPWAGHRPRGSDRKLYDWVLAHAADVVVLNQSKGYPGPSAYHARNEYMVNQSEGLIAVWNGQSTGGTAACVRYAQKIKRPIYRVSPDVSGWI